MKLIKRLALKQEPVSHDCELLKRVWIRKGIIPHLTFLSETAIPAGKIVASHTHTDMTEVFIITSGKGLFRIDENTYDVGAGVGVVIEPGETHMIENTGRKTLQMNYFGVV
jgi:mannose-6-phosphate isomerase-like protein (cupin superfamily)